MASGYSSVDSDSYRRSCSGQRPRTRRRGMSFPRYSKNVISHGVDHYDYEVNRPGFDEETRFTSRDYGSSNRDLSSLSLGNEEITGRPSDRFVRDKHRYGQHTTGNSEDFYSERIQIERDREKRTQDSMGDVFSFDKRSKHQRGRQRASCRANNSSFWDRNWHDDNEMTQTHWRRGGRGRDRAGGRKVFTSHSNTEENPVPFNWREGMTDTSKAVRCFVYYCIYCCVAL